ncbi:MAG TPA: retropepsin-like aspartic protease [Terriglobales bacterium]|nr:retropepsin-like aspartic protease [Terriglobales bacterium]
MRILPVVSLALLGTAMPVSAQWMKMPEQLRTQEYETVAQPDKVDSTTQATDLRFKGDGYDRMTVPVRVAGHGPYRFLIDTGADRTAISSDLARQLQLSGRAGTTLHSVTGETQIQTANVPMLDITAKQVKNIDAALLESEHMGADGILGLDSLRSQRVLLAALAVFTDGIIQLRFCFLDFMLALCMIVCVGGRRRYNHRCA